MRSGVSGVSGVFPEPLELPRSHLSRMEISEIIQEWLTNN